MKVSKLGFWTVAQFEDGQVIKLSKHAHERFVERNVEQITELDSIRALTYFFSKSEVGVMMGKSYRIVLRAHDEMLEDDVYLLVTKEDKGIFTVITMWKGSDNFSMPKNKVYDFAFKNNEPVFVLADKANADYRDVKKRTAKEVA